MRTSLTKPFLLHVATFGIDRFSQVTGHMPTNEVGRVVKRERRLAVQSLSTSAPVMGIPADCRGCWCLHPLQVLLHAVLASMSLLSSEEHDRIAQDSVDLLLR